MLSLAQLQRDIRKSVQARKITPELTDEILSGGLSAEARLQIYQNNYQGTLVDALLGIFPIVTAFVGEVFTRTALKHFIDASPPIEACLSSYGADFSSFLKTYQHADTVPYIADMAALEWAVHDLQHATEKHIGAEDKIIINDNCVFIDSEYPLLNLWMVGSGQLVPESVHIDQGGQMVSVLLDEAEIRLFAVTLDEQTALAQIQDGDTPDNEVALRSLKTKKIILN